MKLNYFSLNTTLLGLSRLNNNVVKRRNTTVIPPSPSRPEGLIGQYKPYLNSNDSPTRSTLKDYSGLGNDIILYNFLYALGSGYGSWAQDFKNTKWYAAKDRATIDVYSSKFIVSSIKSNSACFYYQSTGGEQSFTVPSIRFRVTGLTEGQTLIFNITGTDSGTVQLRFDTDGIHTIDSFEFKGLGNYYGFQFSKLQETCNITIEQIPDYPGALVSDGVDDYGLCENFPILTKENGYTVVALRKWINRNPSSAFIIANGSDIYKNSFVFESITSTGKDRYANYGQVYSINITDDIEVFSTSLTYNNINRLNRGNSEPDQNNIILFKEVSFAPIALYALEIYDHNLTDEEIQSVKEAMYNEYLTATNALQNHIIADYECYDKTNEDEDRDVLKDLSGNGHDIQLYNFGYEGMSGYGLYKHAAISVWNKVLVRGTIVVNSKYSITITGSIISGNSSNYNADITYNVNLTDFNLKFKVTGLKEGQKIFIGRESVTKANVVDKDGIYSPQAIYNESTGKYNVGIGTVDFTGPCNITIEQIPEYQGALVSDGVDDYGLCENFPILNKEDGYTVLAIRKKLKDKSLSSCLLSNRNLSGVQGPFAFELFTVSDGVRFRVDSFGSQNYFNKSDFIDDELFIYGTSVLYNGNSISSGDTEGNNTLNLFRLNPVNDLTYCDGIALYAFKILDKNCTTEEIKFLAKQMVARHKEKTGETITLNI